MLRALLPFGHALCHVPGVTAENSWGAFWRDAGAHGCTDGFPPAAQALLGADWQAIFADAPESSVLDIACGRGALWAHAGAPTRGWVGVDLAQVEGTPFAFRGGVDAAHLPFADRSFALVVSQFGLEYAGLDVAILEAARVCGSRLVALLHAAEGAPCKQAHEQLAQIDWLGAEALAPRLRRHFANASIASAADIDALLAAIGARAEQDSNNSLLEAVWRGVMASQENARGPAAAIDALDTGLAGHRTRLAAMVAAAPDTAAIDAAVGLLREAGFSARTQDAALGGESGPLLVGRWLMAERIQ
jgi:SAM-dependent methyltransferase